MSSDSVALGGGTAKRSSSLCTWKPSPPVEIRSYDKRPGGHRNNAPDQVSSGGSLPFLQHRFYRHACLSTDGNEGFPCKGERSPAIECSTASDAGAPISPALAKAPFVFPRIKGSVHAVRGAAEAAGQANMQGFGKESIGQHRNPPFDSHVTLFDMGLTPDVSRARRGISGSI
jgi:hypothetical protein